MKSTIKKILKEYIEEARLSDLLRVTGDKNDLHSYIEKEKCVVCVGRLMPLGS